MRKTLFEFFSYNLVGILNTLIGFSIIFGLMYLGFSATLSNFIGYSIGATLSYYLNKKFTFKSKSHNRTLMIKFFTILAIAYCLNFFTLQWLLATTNPYIAQLISAGVYTLSSFILAKLLVFNS